MGPVYAPDHSLPNLPSCLRDTDERAKYREKNYAYKGG